MGNAALAAPVNSTTVGNYTLGSLVNDAATGNTALAAAVNSTTVGNYTLGSLTNSSTMGNAILAAAVNSTTVGNYTLGSLVNDAATGNTALAAKVNSDTIGNVTLGSLTNSSTMGNAILAAAVNSATVGNYTLGSLTNSGTMGNAALAAKVNSSTIGNTTLGSLVVAMQSYAQLTQTAEVTATGTIPWTLSASANSVVGVGGATITFNATGVYLIIGQGSFTSTNADGTLAITATTIASPVLATINAGITNEAVPFAFAQIASISEGVTVTFTATFSGSGSFSLPSAGGKLSILRIS